MSTTHNLALWNTNECLERICQGSDVAKHILDADCCHEEDAFALFSLPRQLPRLFTVRFTAPADFTPGDVFTLKGREFALKTRMMEDPSGSVFSAGAVVRLDIDMEQDLAFVTTGGTAQGGGVNFGNTDPLMDGTASAGTSTRVSREDHRHPMLDYSTEEQKTGRKWIDGKDIYYKTVEIVLPSNIASGVNTVVGNVGTRLDTLVDADYVLHLTNGSMTFEGRFDLTVYLAIGGNVGMNVATNAVWFNSATMYLTVYYAK